MTLKYPLEETKYGFKWGPMDLVRMFNDPKLGVIIEIRTPRERLAFRVTPSGLIRVDKIKKRDDPDNSINC